MGGDKGLFSIMDISATALYAERMRMNVIANNIANANTTHTADGKPYRKQSVIFTSKFDTELRSAIKGMDALAGVEIKEIKTSKEPFVKLFIPGHPDADKDGMVLMPNVNIPSELIDMITASRAYDANLAMVRSVRDMMNRTIGALRG